MKPPKHNNTINNTFIATHEIHLPGDKTRIVTVIGVRNEIEKNDIQHNITDHGNKIDAHTVIIRRKVRTFDVVYTIKNPEDEPDNDIASQIINRRLKRNEVHLHLETPQYFGSTMCKMIVQNELQYIVEHIDEFINKL